MTMPSGIPYLPGWGDTIKDNLPSLITGINRLVDPAYDMKQAIKSNPELATRLATLSRDNPDLFNRIYGRKFGDFASTLKESPLAAAQRGVIEQDPEKAARASLGEPSVLTEETQRVNIEAGRQNIRQGQFQLDELSQRAVALAKLPTELREAALTGISPDQAKITLQRTADIDAAKPFASKTVGQLLSDFNSGRLPANALNGLAALNPSIVQEMMDKSRERRNYSVQLALMKAQQKYGMDALAFQSYMDISHEIGKENIPSTAAAGFRVRNPGVPLPAGIPEPTAGEVTAYKEWDSRQRIAAQSRNLTEFRTVLSNFQQKKVGADAAIENLNLILGGLGASVTAEKKPGGVFHRDQIIFKDQSGTEYNQEEIGSHLLGAGLATTTATTLSPDDVNKFRNLTPELQNAWLKELDDGGNKSTADMYRASLRVSGSGPAPMSSDSQRYMGNPAGLAAKQQADTVRLAGDAARAIDYRNGNIPNISKPDPNQLSTFQIIVDQWGITMADIDEVAKSLPANSSILDLASKLVENVTRRK